MHAAVLFFSKTVQRAILIRRSPAAPAATAGEADELAPRLVTPDLFAGFQVQAHTAGRRPSRRTPALPPRPDTNRPATAWQNSRRLDPSVALKACTRLSRAPTMTSSAVTAADERNDWSRCGFGLPVDFRLAPIDGKERSALGAEENLIAQHGRRGAGGRLDLDGADLLAAVQFDRCAACRRSRR